MKLRSLRPMNLLSTFIFSKKFPARLARHAVFWGTDTINYLLVLSVNTNLTDGRIYRLLLTMPWVVLITCIIIYHVIPSQSQHPSKLRWAVWFVGIFIYLGIGIRYYTYYLVVPLVEPGLVMPSDMWDFRRILGEVFSWATPIFMAIAIKLIKNKNELQEKNKQLVKEKRQAELNFLKAQMHPHFLFNTLNTLYADSLKRSERADEIVLHFSSLLRFILEECNKPLIPLWKELKVIEDYIALEKLRHGERVQVNLQQEISDNRKNISPLLLLPFVENSFKHTLQNIRGTISISIDVKSDEDFVFLFVENMTAAPALNGNNNHGMGISNLRRQLELLYPQAFSLDITSEDGKHTVRLKVPLAECATTNKEEETAEVIERI